MIKRTIAVVLILGFVVFPTHIIAGDEMKSVEEYSELFASVYEIVVETNIYEDVNREVLFNAAMEGMFGAVDRYSELMTVEDSDAFKDSIENKYVGVGISLNNIEGKNIIEKVFVGSPAYYGGVRAGDIIVSVDGIDTTAYNLEDLLDILLGEEGSRVLLGVKRVSEEIVFDLKRAPITIPTVEIVDIDSRADIEADLAEETAYIVINSFGVSTDRDFELIMEDALNNGAKNLILDLRGNGGGYTMPAIEIAKMLIPLGKVITFVDSAGDENTYYSNLIALPFEQIITLVDEGTASSSEILASALKDSKASILIGENTFGKGISQYFYQLNEEYYIKMTGQEFFSRDGHKIHQVGIAPDIEVYVPDFIYSDYRMYKGEVKQEVEDLELILDYLGYDVGTIDMIYDDATQMAVYNFQKDQGLYPYGVCDYTTIAAVNDALFIAAKSHDIQLEEAIKWLEEQK